MALNPSIILSGQQFDLAGAMQNGLNMATQQKQFDQQNALANLYKTQGAGIVAGDPNAINALAQFDPAAALGIQNTHQQMQYREEDQVAQRENARKQAEESLKAQGAALDAAQVAAEAKELEGVLSGAAFFYQKQDQAGYDAFLTSKGINPAEYPFQAFPAHAAEFGGVLDAMKTFEVPQINPNDRFKVAGGTIFDLAADGGPKPVGQGAMQETMVMGPDGKPIMVQGGPGTTAKFTEAQSKDTVFATRAEGALAALEGPSDPNNPESPPLASSLTSLGETAAEQVPLIGNYVTGDTFQTARTAGDEFLQAILRKDTGAAITAGEQSLYGATYLPQPGDGDRRLAYKKEARARAVEAIRAGMNAQQIEAMARADAAVVKRIGGEENATSVAPQAGMIEDGFRFKGGDPADPANWEPAQ